MYLPPKTEIRLGSIFFLLCSLFATGDMYEDWQAGESWSHVTFEGSFFLLFIIGAIYLWMRSFSAASHFRAENEVLNKKAEKLKKDSDLWRKEAATVLDGLGKVIDLQFERWKLTSSEKEVGLLLLKGLSHKEIAEVRGTAERTIRQQSISIYRKSSLENRSQLSAFFLEDLLLPSKKVKDQVEETSSH